MTKQATWSVPREWPGQTVFIVAGGPSAADQDLELLRGRKVIAVNASFARVPFADILFFGDSRFWRHYRAGIEAFAGRVVTVAPGVTGERILNLDKAIPPGLSDNPRSAMTRRTSLTGAINVAVHFGAAQIILIGADGKPGPSGRTHHHAPHPWPQRQGCWDEQKKDLITLVAPLKTRGVEVINASPESAWGDLWPVMTLAEAIASLELGKAA